MVRYAGGTWCDPQVDPARVGRNLRISLDNTSRLERSAHHLLTELIEPVAHHRAHPRTTLLYDQQLSTNSRGNDLDFSLAQYEYLTWIFAEGGRVTQTPVERV